MVGITDRQLAASRVLHQRLTRTHTGRRWERMFRAHSSEIAALMAVHPDVRDHVLAAFQAITELAEVGAASGPIPAPRTSPEERSPAEAEPSGEVISASHQVLDDLNRLGTFELRRDAEALREDLSGRSQVLTAVLAS